MTDGPQKEWKRKHGRGYFQDATLRNKLFITKMDCFNISFLFNVLTSSTYLLTTVNGRKTAQFPNPKLGSSLNWVFTLIQ